LTQTLFGRFNMKLNSWTLWENIGLGAWMPLGELCPGGCHHRYTLIAHLEVVSLLIILCTSCLENRLSISRVVPKLLCCGRFIITWGNAHFVVSSNLIESVLVSEYFISGKVHWVLLLTEMSSLLGSKVFWPTSRMVPVRCL